jgi:multicomponent Na+:H+ antiporter subunit D
VLPYARAASREMPREQHYLFYAMFGLCLTGLLGITITGDAFNIFVFLEISSLSTYVLIALGRDRRALMASYQYLIMGSIGATFIVIGIGLLYLMTGTLNLADMAQRLRDRRKHAPGAGGAGLPHRRHLAQAGAVPAAPVAAQRLHLRALGGHRLPRRHGDQGVGLCADALSTYSVFGDAPGVRALPLPQILLALSLAAMFARSLFRASSRTT